MYVYRWNLVAMALALVATACADDGKSGDDTEPEGTNPGECSDGADNDSDGDYDCNDSDCAGAPDCAEDSGGDSGGDSNWVPDDPEGDGFYLHSNGVTVLCPDVMVGAVGLVGATTYTKYDENELEALGYYDTAWESVCTSGVTDMSSMFQEEFGFDRDISHWDTSSVTDMSSMFVFVLLFNQDISHWDTSSVTDMSSMFQETGSFNQDISRWDTSSVTDMSSMFYIASDFNQDLSGWCVSQISSEPQRFDEIASAWTEPRPVWGTCP